MVYSSRGLALLLALCIAIVTSLFLSLFKNVDVPVLLVAFTISFSVSYILIYVVLEFLIFREINKIYKLMGKLKKKELSKIDRQKSAPFNPIKSINEDIYSFAELKQKVISPLATFPNPATCNSEISTMYAASSSLLRCFVLVPIVIF